jgi:hypothetical protein
MSLLRRHMLKLVGGGVILAATAPPAVFLATRTPEKALEPWRRAGQYAEPRMHALSWAILAPNPHNRQPWIAELSGTDTVRIFRDPERNLPVTDPFSRQLTIGMGCFLELMLIAASGTGHGVELRLFPDGEAGPVASATFTAGAARPDPLFAHAAQRRSCKEPFAETGLPGEVATLLASYGRIVTDPATVSELRALTWNAWLTEQGYDAANRESVELMRLGKREIEANPDGIDLGGPMLDTLAALGQISRAELLDPQSSASRQGVAMYKAMLEATPAYAVLTSGGNGRIDQIEAGRRWLRLNLAATGLGLSIHPVSQALQEFAQMKPHFEAAHALLARPGETVQMLGRLGYGPKTPPSPRWPLEARLRDA